MQKHHKEASQTDWVQRIMTALEGEIPEDFVGQVEVNVFKGGISNVNVRQSFKKEVTAK